MLRSVLAACLMALGPAAALAQTAPPTYRWKLSPTAELAENARFTGLFDRTSDWRVGQALAITARLTAVFSLKASNTVRYANAPVQGFKHTDTKTAIALVARF